MNGTLQKLVWVCLGLILCILAWQAIGHAQSGITVPTFKDSSSNPKLSEISELRLVVSYQKALMLKAPFDAAADAYSKLAESERKAAGLPEGTRFEVREDASRPSGWQVLVITPPAKVEPPNGAEPAVKK